MADLSLPALLDAETEVVRLFIDLLQQEQSALQAGDTDLLPAITDAKAPLTIRLNTLAIHRNQALATAGLPPDREGIETWLKRYPSPVMAKAWEALHVMIAEARELNELNGKLIILRMQHTTQALNVLMVAQRQTGMLYGPDGHSAQVSGRRIIDAA